MDINRFITVKEMKDAEAKAIKEHGISAEMLMENAGKAVAKEVIDMVSNGRIMVFCGYGNNGGDGLVASRYLIDNGYRVDIFLVGRPKPFSRETNKNYEELLNMGLKPKAITTKEELSKIFEKTKDANLIIDGIFGVGLKGELKDFYITLIDKINSLGLPVVSVDVPSGLDADTGEDLGAAVKAAKTITFGFAKVGFKNPEAGIYIGKLIVADIGL